MALRKYFFSSLYGQQRTTSNLLNHKSGSRFLNMLAGLPSFSKPELLRQCQPVKPTKYLKKFLSSSTHLDVGSYPMSIWKGKIRSMLKTAEKLRRGSVIEKSILLPSIVVVGDHDTTSVVETLAGIDMPSNISKVWKVTAQVPLVLRLEELNNYKHSQATVHLKYRALSTVFGRYDFDQSLESIKKEIENVDATAIHKDSIYLTVEDRDVAECTIIKLPALTDIPSSDQPEKTCEWISRMMRQQMAIEDAIIVNVLNAPADFSKCRSTRVSNILDPRGERTIAVVRSNISYDLSKSVFFKKLNSSVFNLGCACVCIWDDEIVWKSSNEKSTYKVLLGEIEYFKNHKGFSKLDPSMLGRSALASRLVDTQAARLTNIILKSQQQIDGLLVQKQAQLEKLSNPIAEVSEAVPILNRILNNRRQILERLLEGDCDSYPDKKDMDLGAKLESLFSSFANGMRGSGFHGFSDGFEQAIKENQGVSLSRKLSRTMAREKVLMLQPSSNQLVKDVRRSVETVALQVAEECTVGYPKLANFFKACTLSAVADMEKDCLAYVTRTFEKESSIVYTNNPYYTYIVEKARAHVEKLKNPFSSRLYTETDDKLIPIGLFRLDDDQAVIDLQIIIFAYWTVVAGRLADSIPIELKYSVIQCLLNQVDKRILEGVFLSQSHVDLVELMKEDPSIPGKRLSLKEEIKTLYESKDIASGILNAFLA